MVTQIAEDRSTDPFVDVLPAGVAIRPIDAGLGAEITGVDLSGDVDERTVQVVRDAVVRHGLVVLRGQELSTDAQSAFVRRLFPLRPNPKKVSVYAPPGHPEMQIISNIVEDGERIGFADSGLWWHSDSSFVVNPELFIALHAVQVPQRDGVALGDTCWLSTTAAYDALPAATKERIADLRSVHSYALMIDRLVELGRMTRPALSAEQAAELPDIEQPVVKLHPITGRPILYVNENSSRRIVGWSPADSDELLDELFAHLKQPALQYRHSWRVGDLVIWDNLATQHLANADYGDIPRRLHRSATDGPIGD